MPKIVQYNNDKKFCRKCDKLLVVSENWTRSAREKSKYICNFCSNLETRARRAKDKKPKREQKKCNQCEFLGKLEFFIKNRNICIVCYKLRQEKYRENNKQNAKPYQKKYRAENKEKLALQTKAWIENNKEKYINKKREYNKKNNDILKIQNKEWRKKNEVYVKSYGKKYRQENKEKLAIRDRNYRERNREKLHKRAVIYVRERRKRDISFKLKQDISSRIILTLKKICDTSTKKSFKVSKCFESLGYSPEQLKQHLEAQFEHWMSWDNRGKFDPKSWKDDDTSTWTWHIDHIIPHSEFQYKSIYDDDFKKCWALDNLRPLSAKQNVIDGASRVRHKIKQVDTKIIKE